jgi:hypothetical protein
MSAARKMAHTREQKYIDDAIRERRCKLVEQFSVKALVVDFSLQARVVPIDVKHVKWLAGLRDMGHTLDPVVAFEHPETHVVTLADGFHRWKEVLNRREITIRAYVIVGDDHEAKLYSTMCNQVRSLGRNRDDLRKAVDILLGDSRCARWNDRMIADHVGIQPATVARYRAHYIQEHGLPLPPPRKKPAPEKRSPVSSPESKAKVPDYDLNPGEYGPARPRDEDTAEDLQRPSIRTFEPTIPARRQSLHKKALAHYFYTQGLVVQPSPTRGRHAALVQLDTLDGPNCVCAAVREKDNPMLHAAVARVLLYRAWQNSGIRAVVLCYPDDYDAILLDQGRKLGVEFLTPEQLAESLKEGA